MNNTTVVLYPSGGVGHLTPFVELAKLFISHNFDAVVVLTHLPPSTSSTVTSFTSSITSSNPSISFHYLPPTSTPSSSSTSPLVNSLNLRRLNNPLLLAYLTQLSQTTHISALVIDFFCFAALEVAKELSLASYVFFASGASSLFCTLRLPSLLSELPSPLKDLGNSPLHFPGLPPIPANHFSVNWHDPNKEIYGYFITMFVELAKANGFMVNTFEALESGAVKALAEDPNIPPCYCIGPVLAPPKPKEEEKHECLTWLDEQPKGSVVFLCFGSMGTFSVEQLREIAVGLERSGQRFLWVVRHPKGEDPMKPIEDFLPEGFVERNKERGMVVGSWAPQVAVLSHEAVGGFVSHCGWNSTLEAMSSGVALISWPLYAEQWFNKVILVEEAKVAVGVEGYDKEMVTREEVERKVRWLIESEEGKELKDRVMAMKQSATAAKMDGGSSHLAWKEFIRAIKKEGV